MEAKEPEHNRQIRLLGPPGVIIDGRPVARFRSSKSLAILAYLIQENRPLSRRQLAALFWPDLSAAEAAGSFRRTLHDLTHKVPGAVQVDADVVTFDPSGWSVDTLEFAALYTHPEEAQWQGAVELSRGEFLAGIELPDNPEFEYWVAGQREMYRHQMVAILEQLLARQMADERYDDALHTSWQLLAQEPWRERIHRVVMRLLVRSGQRSSALRQYQICRRYLREELDIMPSAETERLYRRICRSMDLPPFSVSSQTGPFVGREHELKTLRRWLANPDIQLLTISGPEGAGKSRLAFQLAGSANTDLGFRFLDGITCIDVSPGCLEEDLIAPLWAGLGLEDTGEPSLAGLEAFLSDRELLLILDNFSASPDCLATVSALVSGAPDLKIVAITENYLRLPYEGHLTLAGLDLAAGPDGAPSEALRYFFALRERSGLGELSADELAAANDLCRLARGYPLALQTLAHWSGLAGCVALRDLMARLQAAQAAGAAPGALDRQTAEWLLAHSDERERRVLQRLGVPIFAALA